MAAMLVTLFAGGFAGLPLPGPDEARVPFALVICTADGLVRLDPDQATPPAGAAAHGLCLLCLPLSGDGGAAVALLVIVLLAVLGGRVQPPVPAAARTVPVTGFGSVRDVRGPPPGVAA